MKEKFEMKSFLQKILTCSLCLVFVFCFASCADNSQQTKTSVSTDSYQDNDYKIHGLVRGTEDIYTGVLNPESEMPQIAFFQYAGFNNYKLIVVSPWSRSGFPHYYIYEDNLYYLGEFSKSIHAFNIKNPEPQNNITPTDLMGSDNYVFIDLITIEDDWIYLEANKYGTREDGEECYLPGYYLAVNVNGEAWKEISEKDLPKEKDSLS